MNIITTTLLGLACVLPLAQAQAQPEANSTFSGAQVTLPYAELRRLLDASQQQQEEEAVKPPIGAALKSCVIKVSAASADGPIRAEADFSIINLSGQWEWTDLFEGAQVEKTQPAEAKVITRHGTTGLLNREEGNHEVSVVMSGSPLTFVPAEATSRMLELSEPPADHAWAVEGALRVSKNRYSLENQVVSISLKPLITEVASTWNLASELLVDANTTGIHAIGRIALSANEGTGQTARIKLPPEATQVQVEGSDLLRWNLTHDSQGQWLDVRWRTAPILNRNLDINYALPAPAADKVLMVTPPSLKEGDSKAVVALAAAEGIEAAGADPKLDINPGNLPPWMRNRSRSNEMVAQRGSGTFDFSLRYLPRAETADATIPKSTFDMQVVGDGSLLCTANFEIHHSGWTQWEFTLPGEGVLLSCQRNGASADPIISGKQKLSLQLPASSPNADTITRVRLMYTAKVGKMDPVEGALTLKLPTTPLFVQQTNWLLRIPDSYKASAIEGNVAIQPTKKDAVGIALSKAFNHGDEVVAQIHYRKKGLDD